MMKIYADVGARRDVTLLRVDVRRVTLYDGVVDGHDYARYAIRDDAAPLLFAADGRTRRDDSRHDVANMRVDVYTR